MRRGILAGVRMRILEFRIYGGASRRALQPVAELVLDLGRFSGVESRILPGVREELPRLLPGLGEHHCSTGRPGGFLSRLEVGTYLGHVVEHVALELLTEAGERVFYGNTRTVDGGERYYRVVYEYETAELARLAGRTAVRLVGELAGGGDTAERILEGFRERAWELSPGPSTRALVRSARERGIPVRYMGGSRLQLGTGRYLHRVTASLTDMDPAVAVDLAGDKEACRQVLAEAALPVPRGGVAISEKAAVRIWEELGRPVAVKPRRGHHGQGVSLGVSDPEALRRAFRLARRYDREVVVEEEVPGRQIRVLVVDGRMVAAAERFPPMVTGDGRRSVGELLTELNADPRRGPGHARELSRLEVTPEVLRTLEDQALELGSVPEAGRRVLLHPAANLSVGGFAADVTDILDPELGFLAVRATEQTGLRVAGVDLAVPDPARREGARILEVNAAPGLRMHLAPSHGRGRDVAGPILNFLFPPGVAREVPIAAITGTNGKTTVARLVKHLLSGEGKVVGLASTDGLFRGEELIRPGDTTGPRSAALLLSEPIDVAVLETARGGICRGGLGYERSRVGAVLNLTGDHLGQDGIETIEELAEVKALVVRTVSTDGFSVLNADDPLVLRMAEISSAPVILFSLSGENLAVRRHLEAGGRAVYVARGVIRLGMGRRSERLLPLRAIPLTMSGRARPMAEDAVAAAAIGWGMGLSPTNISRGLSSFPGGAETNPGRLNLFELGGIRVIVDYGHNAAAYRAVLRTARALRPTRLIGVIGAPGDRRDEDIVNLGRIAGAGLDYVFIKEDADLRGRSPGEVAELLLRGVLSHRRMRGRHRVVLSEAEAVREALAMASAGDLVVVFYEDLATVQGCLAERESQPGGMERQEIG